MIIYRLNSIDVFLLFLFFFVSKFRILFPGPENGSVLTITRIPLLTIYVYPLIVHDLWGTLYICQSPEVTVFRFFPIRPLPVGDINLRLTPRAVRLKK